MFLIFEQPFDEKYISVEERDILDDLAELEVEDDS